MDKTITLTNEQKRELLNAIAAYNDILQSVQLSCDIDYYKFNFLKDETPEEIEDRINLLKQVYGMLAEGQIGDANS